MKSILEIDDLVVDYESGGRTVRALDGAALSVAPGETVGIVGESGSGKSTLGVAVGGLLPSSARVVGGEVRVDGAAVHRLPAKELRALRRDRLGFVFQEPIGTLDPTMRVGRQVELALRGHGTRADVLSHLERVRLADPVRVAIAMAMACDPEILVADEPTAALDSQIREEVLDVIFTLAAEAGTTILWLSHDLTAVGKRCSRVVVMYGGRVVESGSAGGVLHAPRHPYTAALVRAVPGVAREGERLTSIPGQPPVLTGSVEGCAFAPRCPDVLDSCGTHRPVLRSAEDRDVLCHRADETVGVAR